MPAQIWFSAISGLAIGFSFMNIPPVADQFMKNFNIGYAGLSLFLSGLLWSHSLSQIPAGLLSDKLHPARLLKIAFAAAVVLNLLPFAIPTNAAAATLFRFLLGLCTGVSFLAVMQVLALLAPPEEMPKAQGYYGGAFGFGTMLPYFVLPLASGYADGYGWICSYLFTALLYLAALIGAYLLPREAMAKNAAKSTDMPGIPTLLRRVLTTPDIWMLGVIHGIFYGTLTNIGQWLPSILADVSGKPLAAWTLATTLVLFIGSTCRWFSGHAAKIISRRRLVGTALILVFALYCLLGAAQSGTMGIAAGLLLAVPCGLCHGTLFSMGARTLPAAFMGTALGLLNTVANLTNVGLTLLFGYTRETTGSFSFSLYAAGCLALGLAIVCYRRFARLDARLELQ